MISNSFTFQDFSSKKSLIYLLVQTEKVSRLFANKLLLSAGAVQSNETVVVFGKTGYC